MNIEQHYRANRDRLVSILTVRCGNRDDAEDIVQEAYLNALEHGQCPVDFDKWFSWIVLAARIKIGKENMLHGMTGWVDPEASDTEGLHGFADGFDPEQRVLIHEIIGDIVALIGEKAPYTSHILQLALIHQMGAKEIADLLLDSPDNVAKIVSRFRAELKRKGYHKKIHHVAVGLPMIAEVEGRDRWE